MDGTKKLIEHQKAFLRVDYLEDLKEIAVSQQRYTSYLRKGTFPNLYVYILDDDSGELQRIDLGSNCLAGETFQYVVPANRWFASIPAEDSSFSFAGCTVAPGFDFADFELAKKDDLLLRFPQHSEIISKLTRE